MVRQLNKNQREYILKRDGYKCSICGCISDDLTVHHIRKRCNGGTNDPENLISLCQDCHVRIHKWEEIRLSLTKEQREEILKQNINKKHATRDDLKKINEKTNTEKLMHIINYIAVVTDKSATDIKIRIMQNGGFIEIRWKNI